MWEDMLTGGWVIGFEVDREEGVDERTGKCWYSGLG